MRMLNGTIGRMLPRPATFGPSCEVPVTRAAMVHWWDDLTFVHWRYRAEDVQRLLPAGLTAQTFDGSAWVSLVPFFLRVGLPIAPPLPWASQFAETNVRTYVTSADGEHGIWFFSLDAESQVAVEAARRLYKLPYFRARMSAWPRGRDVEYETSRRDRSGHLAQLRVTYGPRGEPFAAEPGSLEHFLTERYCLYATDEDARLHRAEIHHPPWALQRGEAGITQNTMPPPGIDLPGDPPHVLFSRRQDVVIWAPALVP